MKYFIYSFIILTGLIFMTSCDEQTANPPKAKIVTHTDTTFSDVRSDNYFWLRERRNPDVRDYLEAENKYTEQMMRHTKPLQKALYKEMVGRIKETDESVPYQMGAYFYYSRTEQGKQYRVHCRKKGSLQAPEEILIDENKLAEGHKYFRVGVFQVSPDQSLLAWSVDTTGGEKYTIYFKNLKTGEILPDQIPDTYYSLAWANDNKTVFYNILDEAMRPYKLFRHRLGTEAKNDPLVYEEKDEKFFLRIGRSKSGRYLFMDLHSQITSEIRFLNADAPQGKFKVIAPRKNKVEYSVGHQGKYFYIRTNDNAVDFRLVRTPVNRTANRYWQEIIPGREKITISSFELFKNYLVVFEREKGLDKIRFKKNDQTDFSALTFDEADYSVWPVDNRDYNLSVLRFGYSSLKTPRTVYDYDMVSKQRVLKKQQEVLNGYDPQQYVTERLFVAAEDGAQIPVSLIYKKGMKKDGSNPLYLYGYGSYGINIEPYFSVSRVSLLDRGFVYAIAHIRGSSTMGRMWYENGKLLHKKNTFSDFIACAEYLIAEKYTNSEKLSIAGGSAGGLLIGAVLNMRPDLFKAAAAHVPFVDVINTMLDPSLPLTVIEYEEWGNPHIEKYYRYMKSYSPYDNVQAKAYPNILITAGLNDPRVQYWEPAKWTAKLRALKTDKNLLLLKTNMGAGHGGASGRYSRLKEIAFEYAFILDRLGIAK